MVDDPVSVSAILRFIELRKGAVTILADVGAIRAGRLRGKVAKQFLAVVDLPS
ncbi:MAG TPA: hypothetical protein VF753_17855 [Terriglobales bacterium]